MKQREFPSPWGAVVLAWLIPGAGHMLLRQWFKGVGSFVLLVAAFVFGWGITHGQVVSYDLHPFAFIAQIGAGLPTLLGLAKTRIIGPTPLAAGIVPFIDMGLLYTTVAGLLNILLIQDAYEAALALRSEGEEK